ncbi:hypothetical protein [Undibacterium sp. KW1]|uniref:hypothetical protein n=1 Tax=Undibacterium sp. KW1 TaxID=2058624 RepID=UPI00138A0D60|nr:hypothetical protein [Undibacterium sp. KW1]
MKFQNRTIAVLELPLPQQTLVLRPEAVIIKFPGGRTSDVGSLCFQKRREITVKKMAKRRTIKGREVELQSINSDRILVIRKLILYASDALLIGGKRPETVRNSVNRFVTFVDWVDQNNYQDSFKNAENIKSTFRAYVQHLRERVKLSSISINGAFSQQISISRTLEEICQIEDLTRGINSLKRNHQSQVITRPPSEEAQGKILSLCTVLFEELSSFLIDFKQYPFEIPMPSYLNYLNNKLWIFPTNPAFLKKNKGKRENYAYKYAEGRIATFEELRNSPDHLKKSTPAIKLMLETAILQIRKSNSNGHNIHRVIQGFNALNYFLVLFVAETGMNWAQVQNLTWSEDYEVKSENQFFRTIKWRADNRIVFFELPISFMPRFKKFLKLREFLLNGQTCKWLFFHRGSHRDEDPQQIKFRLSNSYQILKNIDPNIEPITTRQWRAAKSDWLIRNTDPATSAAVLQNTEKTVLASYLAGSPVTQMEEITKFLDGVSQIVEREENALPLSTSRSVGSCVEYGKPQSINFETTTTTNCRNVEGCFFCRNFRIHQDERDIRKLVSCRYCLQEFAKSSGGNVLPNSILFATLNRVDEILSEIAKKNTILVSKIVWEVEEQGELDQYWASKLEMLMALGIVL